MPITELALLHTLPGKDLAQPALKAKLLHAKTAMANFTHRQFSYYTQVEDPTHFYLVGEWDSAEQHLDEWLPSQANQDLLALLKDEVHVDWMFHVDVERDDLPLDAPVLAIGRHMIADEGGMEGFAQTFAEVAFRLSEATAPRALAGGWRMEGEDEGKGEWVLFSGWDSVEKHTAFGKTEGFKDYSRIVPFVERFEVKHARPFVL